jgi:predicted nucleic acid-binding protein
LALTDVALLDTSVLTRFRRPEVAREVDDAFERGRLFTCAMVRLEVLRGAQSRALWRSTSEQLDAMPDVQITEQTWQRALTVQSLLVPSSHHTAVKIADLVIAATAELVGLPVIHYDRDFDLIAEVSGQDCRWVVPRGSID